MICLLGLSVEKGLMTNSTYRLINVSAYL